MEYKLNKKDYRVEIWFNDSVIATARIMDIEAKDYPSIQKDIENFLNEPF